MGNMAESLKRTHVVVMLVESRNGPWPPTIGNFLAAHDDVVKRVRIQEGAKIATGLSGGARASSIFVQLRPDFAGRFCKAPALPSDEKGKFYFYDLLRNQSIFVAMVIGRKDPRRSEIFEMERQLGPKRFGVLFLTVGTNGRRRIRSQKRSTGSKAARVTPKVDARTTERILDSNRAFA